jgi:hypothetical protein
LSWLGGGIKPGNRLPDAIVTSAATGKLERLLSSLGGTSFHLLLLASEINAKSTAVLAQVARQTQSAFGNNVRTHLIYPGPALHDDAGPFIADFENVWLDLQRTLHAQHAVHEPSLVLVRPDGYVCFRSQPADGAALSEHLSRMLRSRECQFAATGAAARLQ